VAFLKRARLFLDPLSRDNIVQEIKRQRLNASKLIAKFAVVTDTKVRLNRNSWIVLSFNSPTQPQLAT
jgi:hypothetical protein